MLGFTGVVWFPRGATRMSVELYGGPGPAPLSAASAAWGSLTAELTDASVALAAVVAQLAAGWRGPAADMAVASFANFGVWLGEAVEHAGRMSGTTGAGAAAYLASAAVMPSPAEIAVTKAAMAASTVAAASTGAGLGAALAVTEAAEREMDIRATLAMEGYESASSVLSVPIPFRPAPPIAIPELQGAGLAADLFADIAAEALTEVAGPVGGQAVAHGTGTAASIATHPAGLEPTGAAPSFSPASPVAAKPVLPAFATQSGAAAMPGMAGAAGGAGIRGTRNPVGTRFGTTGLGATKLGVPMAGALAGAGAEGARHGSSAAAAGERTAASSRIGAGPMRSMGGAASDTDDDYDPPDYLRRLDRLEDGREVVPAVIGVPGGGSARDSIAAGP